MLINDLIELNKPLILASQSPRRKKLLAQLGFKFEVIPANADEENNLRLPPEDLAMHLAEVKAETVAKQCRRETIVLGSDTIVVLEDEILNKPADPKNAIEMLMKLSGKTHTVITGICLFEAPSMRYITKTQKTLVTFRELNMDEIIAYVTSGSPLDKAGAYGIQDDFGAVFVSRIEGCYYNIVGLPLELLYTTLRSFINEI